MADGRIIIDTQIDSSGAEKDIKGLSTRLSGVAKTGLAAFTGMVTATGAAIGGLATVATKYNSQMEDYFANFTVLLGSATEATKHVEDLKKFAAKTPFEMTGLADASKQLLSFGIGVEDIMPDLQMLGDISLGNQERFKGLALVFAQVASAGKLTGQDLLQFINQGFNPLQVIAEKTGKSMADLKDEMSDGKITYEMVAEAMKTATSEGGKFYQGMEVQSKTLSGQWSTLKDDTMSLIGDAFKPFSEILKSDVMPALQGMVVQMSEAFGNPDIQNSISNIASGLGDLAIKIGELVSEWLPKLIDGFAWILNNGSEIATIIGTITAAMVAFKAGAVISGVIKSWQEAKVALALYKLTAEATTISQGVLNGVFSAWEIIVALFTGKITLATAATALWTKAQAALNAVMSANPIGIILVAITVLIGAIIYLWNTNEDFRNAIINAWNAVKEAGLAVWDWLVKFFTEDIPNAWNALMEFFAGIPEWFGTLWATIKQFFIDGWNSIVSFFTETIPLWITNIVNWFNELPYKIGYMLGELIAKFVQWGIDINTFFTETIPKLISDIGIWFSELPGKVMQWLTDTLTKAITWCNDMNKAMVEKVIEIVNSISNWFAELPGRISSKFNEIISNVISWGSDLYNRSVEAVKDTVNGIIEWFSDLPGKMVDIGKNIISGIWEGITGMGDWLWDKITGFGSGVVDGFLNAFKIHSPSRVMRDLVGTNIVKGIGVGIDIETPNLEKDIDSNMADLVAKMQSTVDYETANTTARVVAHNNKLSGGVEEDTKGSGKQVIENHIHVDVEGKEVAYAIAPYQDILTEYYDGR